MCFQILGNDKRTSLFYPTSKMRPKKFYKIGPWLSKFSSKTVMVAAVASKHIKLDRL